MAKSKRRSTCPISMALDLFGDKWTLLIIRDLIFNEKHYFGEFLKSEEKIATNILTDRLQLLEQFEVVTKKTDPSNGSKFIYNLTTKGIDLLPVIIEMILWSDRYNEVTWDENFIARAKKDKNGLIKQLVKEIQENN